MFERASLYLLLTLATLISIGCNTGNRQGIYEAPASALEDAIQVVSEDPIFDIDGWLPQSWWTLFQDEQLSCLIETALMRNPSLQIARANTLKAASIAQKVRSTLFPDLNWGADVSRQKFSETGIIPFNINPSPSNTPFAGTGGLNGIPVYFTQYETELTLTYDFDIWGKNRNTWKAALSEVQASIADEIFTRLQLSINVARVYFQLQVDYKRKKLAEALISNRERLLNTIEQRVRSNVENALSINTYESNLLAAKQALLQIEGDIAVKQYQLQAYLAGNFDEDFFDSEINECQLPKIPLPTDLPLHLIARRPDITAQLWLIESAGKQIEVAKAGFYPDFNLTALFGFQTLHFPELFRYPSTFFNVDPAVSLPIFDGGRLLANLRGSCINYDLAILRYNDLVINAAREVLEGIAVLKNVDQQLQEFMKNTQTQDNLFQLTNLKMQHNLSSTIDTLISEGNLLTAESQQNVALGNTLQAMLSLIKALGGGYHECIN